MEEGSPSTVQEGTAILRGYIELHNAIRNLALSTYPWAAFILRLTTRLLDLQALHLYFQAGPMVKREGKSAFHQILPATKALSQKPHPVTYISISLTRISLKRD